MAQASKISLEGALSPYLGGPRASCSSSVSPPYTCDLQELVFLQSSILLVDVGTQEALRLGWRWDKAGLSHSLQAEEDKEEQTDRQTDASSSQPVFPVAEPLNGESTPPDGPTSLGPLKLLPSEELLTDTSNSSSSTGEEGEAGGLNHFFSCM